MRIATVIICSLLLLAPSRASGSPGVSEAIRLSYNFQFDAADRLLKTYREQRPSDPESHIAQIIVDYLQLQQDPRPVYFASSYANLERAKTLAAQQQKSQAGPASDFFFCLVQHYYMKTYSLDKRWLATVASANQSRKLALELQQQSQEYPDILFILGDQDYTATLVPGYLKPLFHAFNFRATRAEGLNYIRQAKQNGRYTRYEAAQLDITLTTYIENDYPAARISAERFLTEFPDNLSVRFMYVDILLRQSEIDTARNLLTSLEYDVRLLPSSSKWQPRYSQMQANLLNAQGLYRQAIAAYQKTLDNPNTSSVSVGEIYLEIGKLYDILGDRPSAQTAYTACIKSDGLELHKEEARQYSQQAWRSPRASY
jgi:tetratricopeptide (TPR) repeat protein